MKACSFCSRPFRTQGTMAVVASSGSELRRVRVCPDCEAKALKLLIEVGVKLCACGTAADVCSGCTLRAAEMMKQRADVLAGSSVDDGSGVARREGIQLGLRAAAAFLETGEWE